MTSHSGTLFDMSGLFFATGSGHELGVKELCQLYVYKSIVRVKQSSVFEIWQQFRSFSSFTIFKLLILYSWVRNSHSFHESICYLKRAAPLVAYFSALGPHWKKIWTPLAYSFTFCGLLGLCTDVKPLSRNSGSYFEIVSNQACFEVLAFIFELENVHYRISDKLLLHCRNYVWG